MTNKQIKSLQEAVTLSPDNAPLRKHLADTFLSYGQSKEAETEYRAAIDLDPDNLDYKLGLAKAFFQLETYDSALVVIEDLVSKKESPAEAYVLYARLLLKNNEMEAAQQAYQTGIEKDRSIADPLFASDLGINHMTTVDEENEDNEFSLGEDPIKMPIGGKAFDSQSPSELERPDITFEDVGGMENVKEEVRIKIIHPLKQPDLYKAYGKTAGGGILLYGPPGCGKTHLARATAGEVKAGFLSVGINEVLDMYIGSSERNLHAIFENARAHRPCVLFFDEVDALGASRTQIREGSTRQVINQFLSELDGVKYSNDDVLILAATNAPWHLDSAFRRPGRFDRIIFVPPPDEDARASVLNILLTGKPTDGIDYAKLAKKTGGFSGADLQAVVDIAIEEKLRAALKSGTPEPLSTSDLLSSAKQVKPSVKEWFATAKNYALYSNQGGVYDDILEYLKMK